MVTIDERDRAVVQLVARFKQLTTAQIDELLFADVSSRTPSDRTLRRLVERGLLSRVERRLVGGARGGSGLYVYQLGSAGHNFLLKPGQFRPWRTVNHHAIGIADTYVQLVQLERADILNIVGYSTEPDCHVTIRGQELRPDLYIEVEKVASRRRMRAWIEYDAGSEGQRQIRNKLAAYWRAYNDATEDDIPEWPRIYWVAIDQHRADELAWLIKQEPADMQALFRVFSTEKFPTLFSL